MDPQKQERQVASSSDESLGMFGGLPDEIAFYIFCKAAMLEATERGASEKKRSGDMLPYFFVFFALKRFSGVSRRCSQLISGSLSALAAPASHLQFEAPPGFKENYGDAMNLLWNPSEK